MYATYIVHNVPGQQKRNQQWKLSTLFRSWIKSTLSSLLVNTAGLPTVKQERVNEVIKEFERKK